MSPSDGAYDSPTEAVDLELDTSGLAMGRHMLFARAKNADGNRGPVSAAFFWITGADARHSRFCGEML
jgi:hypothetical protein